MPFALLEFNLAREKRGAAVDAACAEDPRHTVSAYLNRLPSGDKRRPLRALYELLPQLSVEPDGTVVLANSPPELLRQIAENAETAIGVISLGISAVGNIMSHAAPEVEDGSVAFGTIEALGWFLADLGEISAALLVLSAKCSRQAAKAV